MDYPWLVVELLSLSLYSGALHGWTWGPCHRCNYYYYSIAPHLLFYDQLTGEDDTAIAHIAAVVAAVSSLPWLVEISEYAGICYTVYTLQYVRSFP